MPKQARMMLLIKKSALLRGSYSSVCILVIFCCRHTQIQSFTSIAVTKKSFRWRCSGQQPTTRRGSAMTMNAYLDSLSKTTSSSTTTSPGAPKRNYGISSPTLLHQPTVDHHQILTDKKSEQEEQGDQLAEGRHRPAADWKKKFNYDDIDLTKSRTQRIMERTTSSGQVTGAGGQSTYDAFLAADQRWTQLKQSKAFSYDSKLLLNQQYRNGPKVFVTDDACQGNNICWDALRQVSKNGRSEDLTKELDYDVVVCGGTLGIFIGLTLQLKGYNVAVIEAGKLMGREQEWNISRRELGELIKMQLVTKNEVEQVITTEFPGCRSGFKNEEVPTRGGYQDNGIGFECFTSNVLNLGVSPNMLIEIIMKRFEKSGGTIFEKTRINGIVVSESTGAALDVATAEENAEANYPLTTKLVLDCMGNASPISAQQRYGLKPDGVCAVVGSCASGYDPKMNKIGDIIYTNTEMQDKTMNGEGQMQYFWEAFPVGIGRNGVEETNVKTTYMFTYMDGEENRPSLSTLMEDYWKLLPMYQPSITDAETELDVKRVLFAYFPTYRDSPLKPKWSRILSVGDASGIQSPLSFGGFGALTRHLERISGAVADALNDGCLHKDDLGLINFYTPNLSAAWMFQRAMSVRRSKGATRKSNVDPKFVNRLLATNFEVMFNMGNSTMVPFLQDVVRIDGLLGSLSRSFVKDPTFMPEIIAHVGIPALAEWIGHTGMIGVYTGLHIFITPLIKPFVISNVKNARKKFRWKRMMEAWEFGSGSDYKNLSEYS